MKTWAHRALMTASAYLLVRALQPGDGTVASVVIVTRNRATYLDLTLAALEHQCFPADDWEVVVADHASSDDTPGVLDRHQLRAEVWLRWTRVPAGGREAALNEALRLAKGRIIVFLSDRGLVGPDFLLRHLIRQVSEPCVVLGDNRWGIHTHLLPAPSPALTSVPGLPGIEDRQAGHLARSGLAFEQGPNYGPVLGYIERRGLPNRYLWVCFDAGNASVPREIVLRAGGFDEGTPGWDLGSTGLAGTEFAYRLHQLGLPFRFEPRAYTLCQSASVDPVLYADRARALGYFFCKHPELRCSAVQSILVGPDVLLDPPS